MISIVREGGVVDFPAFLGERVYMHEFRMGAGLPEHLKRWQHTVDQMLIGVDTDGPIYLMIDQKTVTASSTHRRPGLHVDGYWVPAGSGWDGGGKPAWNGVSAHGGGSHRARPEPPSHGGGSHRSLRAFEWPGHPEYPTWRFDARDRPEAIILASDISASRGLVGEFDGPIKVGGDVSHLDLSHLEQVLLQAGRVYQGNVSFIHESLPVPVDCQRTLVRLNVPGHRVH
ncbi:hypothetical protein [Pseudomonas sp. PNPG3]|uniref:hypothetical protein n=1 Tax=Pseudomonas sp. PNPG3 TaxID=2919497 RepID=UPI001FFC65B8|nr:hypothetical protein [Pseudomonas sp. PNPG3]MCK2122069.1 hypothetical protein [Pseudomonas sp. PNPG3]